jgi:hypothetical protein
VSGRGWKILAFLTPIDSGLPVFENQTQLSAQKSSRWWIFSSITIRNRKDPGSRPLSQCHSHSRTHLKTINDNTYHLRYSWQFRRQSANFIILLKNQFGARGHTALHRLGTSLLDVTSDRRTQLT